LNRYSGDIFLLMIGEKKLHFEMYNVFCLQAVIYYFFHVVR